jgi:tetratricopeptide (TPR) repeat protein
MSITNIAVTDSTISANTIENDVVEPAREEQPVEENAKSAYDIDSLKNYAACIKTGTDLMEKGYYFQAREIFHKALGMEPNNPEVYNLLGRAYYYGSDNEKAKMFLKTAIAIDPEFADAYYNLGDVYFREGKLSEAMDSFKTAIQINPAYRAKTRPFYGEMFAPLE